MKRQASLSLWISRPASKRRTEGEELVEQSNEKEALVDQADHKEIEEPVQEQAELSDEEEVLQQSDEAEEVVSSVAEQEENCGRATSSTAGDCNCCRGDNAIQPTDKTTLSLFVRNKRKFLPSWYSSFPWITLCVGKKKVFCVYCRFAKRHSCLLAKKGDDAFSVNGFDNYAKATVKFRAHDRCDAHREAMMKWQLRNRPTIAAQLSSEVARVQTTRRAGLLKQLTGMRFLLRQGIALRGHSEREGNLPQLLSAWAGDCEVLRQWMKEGKYMSHDIVNELITIMGHNVLRAVLDKVKMQNPAWYAIIADEATDVNFNEQLNLSLRYVDYDYTISEDPVGLFCMPNTTAATLSIVIKDMLTRCSLPLANCRGQAYDGAATMQGKRSGLATRICNEIPAALPVHCLAHSLNLCLQDAARKVICLRDALAISREICKLIHFSPKRRHLFSEKLQESGGPTMGVKPLCPTRWTVRTEALNAVIKQYPVIMETMDEVNRTTHDDYGLKAGGVLSSLEKFETLFGLKLAHLLFGAAEETSKVLQAKNTCVQEAVSAVTVTRTFYQRQRLDEAFDRFFDSTVSHAQTLNIGMPRLPRFKKPPKRYSDSEPHRFAEARDYFRLQYFQGCDLLIQELTDRFEQRDVMTPVLGLESLLLKAANGEDIREEFKLVKESVFSDDLYFDKLESQLAILVDTVHLALPEVKKVTSVRTICEAMRAYANRKLLSEVHKLIRLYLTIPITSATSERTFSVLRRLLTYMRSTMTEKRLNNCLLIHVHKDVTEQLDLVQIAKEFVSANDERRTFFGAYS